MVTSLLDEGFRATGRNKDGVIRLRRAQIAGDLSLSGTKLVNEIGSALDGTQLQVGGNLRLDEKFSATGNGDYGAVWIPRACITGALFLSAGV